MNEKDILEIDFLKLLKSLWKRLPIILLITVAAGLVTFVSLRASTKTVYTAKASFLVQAEYKLSDPISIDTYCYAAKSPSVCKTVIEQSSLSFTTEQLAKMVSAKQENANANAFTVIIKSGDKQEALQIAQSFARVLPDKLSEILPDSPIHVLDAGSVQAASSAKVVCKNAILYAVLSGLISVCFFAVMYIFEEASGKIWVNKADLRQLCPNLAVLGEFASVGDTDALNRLRTNVRLALPDEGAHYVIGVTAAHDKTAKDDLLVRVASSLAELGDRVLLIDTNLRSPSLVGLENKASSAGLSELIRREASADSLIHSVQTEKVSFAFLPAGNGASEAAELLDSRKLLPVLQDLQDKYDYVLLDLEPVNSTIDYALTLKYLSGVIVAMREEVCSRKQLYETITQLRFAKANILGFVLFKHRLR